MSVLMDKRMAAGELPGEDGLYKDERELLGYANAFIDLGPKTTLITRDEAAVLVEALMSVGRFRTRRIEDLITAVREPMDSQW